jgi:hypothetical protein
MESIKENPKAKGSKPQKNTRSRNNSTKTTNTQPKKPVKEVQDEEGSSSSSEEDEGELCFICTEPVVTYAVAQCDHRTCHRCTLRLRALYETRNCAYCKVKYEILFNFYIERYLSVYLDRAKSGIIHKGCRETI